MKTERLVTIILFLFLTPQECLGQTGQYHPFPESNAHWNVEAEGCCWSNCSSPPLPNPVIRDYLFSYSITGDTVINSQTYRKLHKSGTMHEHCLYGSSINNWIIINEYA
ncbi:MAG: hypothetical protein DWQ48_05965 [Bacteroidetes bacterium]|nr:MAG: hypothetical protein DWQ48_05965 [Bacteroidota bacterium]